MQGAGTIDIQEPPVYECIIAQLLYATGFGASMILLVVFFEILESCLIFRVLGGRISNKREFDMPTIAGLSTAASSSQAYVMAAIIFLGAGSGLFTARTQARQ